MDEVDLQGLSASPVDVPVSTTRFDLVLNLEESEAGLRGALEYSTDLFDSETADRMVGHLLTLLRSVAADPAAKVLEIPVLTDGERTRILGDWAGGSAEFDADTTPESPLRGSGRADARRGGRHVRREALRYRELNARANQLAHRLQRLGVGPDVLVGLCVERSLDLVVAILGILKAGGAYVPLDPAYPPDRLALLLEDAGVAVVVGHGRAAPRPCRGHDAAIVLLDAEAAEIAPRAPRIRRAASGRRISRTSSTRPAPPEQPKGVPVSHANVARLFDATDAWYGFGCGRRVDALPLVRVRLLRLGAVGGVAVRRPAGRRARTGSAVRPRRSTSSSVEREASRSSTRRRRRSVS